MLYYTVKRVLMTIPVMGIVAFFVFSLLYITPGDPAVVMAGEQATPEQVKALSVSMGLDQPFLVRFVRWTSKVVQGDLGNSILSNQPVSEIISQRIGPTFSLLICSMAVSVVLSVLFGVVAAWQRGKWADRLFTLVTALAFSIPVFVVGYMLAYVFASQLKWFPVQGYSPPSAGWGAYLKGLVLPSLTLGTAYSALIARTTRASMLEVLSQDYIRTARAKGALMPRILFRHALKNASIPIVTVIGLGVAHLIGGAVITESVFAIPGMGTLTLDAILQRDYPVIQGVVLLFSASYVLVNLIVDLLYTLLDPRISY